MVQWHLCDSGFIFLVFLFPICFHPVTIISDWCIFRIMSFHRRNLLWLLIKNRLIAYSRMTYSRYKLRVLRSSAIYQESLMSLLFKIRCLPVQETSTLKDTPLMPMEKLNFLF